MSHFLPIILASTSVFRQQQLRDLGVPFEAVSPDFDETPEPNETPQQTALRLAEGKARSLENQFKNHIIIGADQVAFCQGKQLGKPMNVENARAMLSHLSGQQIEFYSALCVLNTASGELKSHVDTTTVQMRVLSAQQIERYLQREPDAIYCAGAAKSEALGAALLQRIDSTDPNALIGLPIFKLIDFLLENQIDVLNY